jgi:hypothetical protein
MTGLRAVRRILATCTIALYLLAGALHGICGLDVANSGGKSEMSSLIGKDGGHSDQMGSAERHCHGCFSVTMPQTPLATVSSDIPSSNGWSLPVSRHGILIDIDSPPPKHLI